MKAISLFSGAGGMDVGFQHAGYRVVAANEIDQYACQTFQANHPNVRLLEGDINHCLEALEEYTGIDVIFGGPPCQGFSVAGKMEADDPRSQLIFRFCAVVERLQPKAFVMENVKSLASLSKFEDIRSRLILRFRQAGYAVTMHVLNAKDFGIPQSRERVFFIGVKDEFFPVSSSYFSPYKREAPLLRQVLIPLGKPGSENNKHICNAKITIASKPVLRRSPYAGMLFNGQGRPLNPDGWANTLPASMGGNRTPIIDDNHLYHGAESWVEHYHRHLMAGGQPYGKNDVPAFLRRLTINEASVLQTFPLNYAFCGPTSKIYSQIGNAVPCVLANVVAKAVLASLQSRPQSKINISSEEPNIQLSLL
ncbi:MAG: DNA cytosine methyltransferase [Cyanobacteria bacterium P01_F01_bin.150]